MGWSPDIVFLFKHTKELPNDLGCSYEGRHPRVQITSRDTLPNKLSNILVHTYIYMYTYSHPEVDRVLSLKNPTIHIFYVYPIFSIYFRMVVYIYISEEPIGPNSPS